MNEFDPFAFGGRQDDAELLEAAAEMQRFLDESRDLEEDDEASTRRWKRIGECMTFLNATMPKTFAGCMAKLRFLANEEVGMEAGDREDDVPSLRQVLAFIEAELGNGGAA
jgi:hypothetical protein